MLGTSFSADHARSLDLDPVECLTALLDMGLQTIRLAAYWNQIQPSEDIFDFSDLKWQLDVCEARGISVVLVVGMKAPRWPEFYIPEWAKNLSDSDFESALFSYLQRTVQWAQKWSCLEYWQVENEPLDPSGPEWRRVPLSLLQKEVALVRECDLQNRPIVLTAWGNEMLSRGTLAPLSELGDVVGIDVYPRVFIRRVSGRNIYASFWWQRFTISFALRKMQKPVWISELQAEPWEESSEVYRSASTQSINPQQLIWNWQWAQSLPVSRVFLWGGEYWIWRARQNDPRYVELIQRWL